MGEVFRSRDTKLDRDVAIKILPDGRPNPWRSHCPGTSGYPVMVIRGLGGTALSLTPVIVG